MHDRRGAACRARAMDGEIRRQGGRRFSPAPSWRRGQDRRRQRRSGEGRSCEKRRSRLGDGASRRRARSLIIWMSPTPRPTRARGAIWPSGRKFTDEIATIGDKPNDVLMFQKAALDRDGQRQRGGEEAGHGVTDIYRDEGFAKAVEQFILGGEHG